MRKAMYIPGTIVIIGLVFLFCYLMPSGSSPVKHETVIKHFLPPENSNSIYAVYPSGYQLIDEALAKKNVIHISLTGKTGEDDKKMAIIQREARRLKYTNDTSSIIEIQLSTEITYGRFVGLVNMMLEDGHKRYGLWKNNFYIIFGPAAPSPQPPQGDTIRPFYL